MVVCADSERALAVQRTYVYGFMVVWTRVWVCGGAALLSRATQRCVELCGHDSAIQGCIARSASWPSINLAGLICDWISMPPSNVAMVIRSRYQRRRRIENFGPAPPPPSTKSVILGGGSDPPSTKSVILGGGSGVFPFRAPPPGAMCAPPRGWSPRLLRGGH